MFRKMLVHRRSIVLTWLISYMTILLLPILISVFVYVESSKTLKGEIHQANGALLNQVRGELDNQFQAMQQLNLEITWNSWVQYLIYSGKYSSLPGDYYYDLYQITKDLKRYQLAYSQVESFYIYLANTNSIVLPSVVREGELAYEVLHQSDAISYADWSTITNQKNVKGFFPMQRVTDEGQVKKTVAFVSSYSTDKTNPVATNVLMIDQSRIFGAFENMELFNKGKVFIINENNEVLFSNSGDTLPVNFPYEKLRSSSDLFYLMNNKEKYEILYMNSFQTGLKYVLMLPSSLYWQKAEHIRKLTYISILLSLIGGGLLTTLFLRINYNPVRRLMEAFSKKSEIHIQKDGNEFQFIQQAVDNTLIKMDTIMEKMEQQNHILRSHFIVRLLKGRLDSRIPIDESLAVFHMQFDSDDFAVMLLYVEESGAFYERIGEMESGDKRKLLQFIVTNVVEELAGRQNQGYVTEVDEALACLINFSRNDEPERKNELQRIAREAQQFLASHYDIQLTLSISAIHSSVVGVSQAYVEALDAMEYKLVMGRKEILSYQDIQNETLEGAEVEYYYPLQVEQQVINYVKIGDFAKAKQTVDDIIDRNFNRPAVSVSFARCLMLNLVSTMIKTVSETGSVQDSFLVQNPKCIERLTACDTIQEMQLQMTDLLMKVCEYTAAKRRQNVQQLRRHTRNGLIARISGFIKDNYHDPSLNISMIGSRFAMKPTYLSKLFKEQTGEGLLDYINKVRIDKAKQLIAEHDHHISDVAGCVGFHDVNTFIRTFKKYEGITPGKFKETAMA